MRPAEWDQIVADELLPRWPHSEENMSDATLRVWAEDLADLQADQVRAAIRALARDGREFAPNGAQIRNKVIELGTDMPDWSQVFRALRHLVASGYCYPLTEPSDREALLGRQPPVVRAFVEYIGLSQLREGLTGEGGDEARLREKWLGFHKRVGRELAYRGLPSAGLPQLERIEAQRRAPRKLGRAIGDVLALQGAGSNQSNDDQGETDD
jgi:hypothetical protein